MSSASSDFRLRARRVVSAFGVALLLASLVNGAWPYLARLGLVETAKFDRFVSTYCPVPGPTPADGPTCWCMQDPDDLDAATAPGPGYLYQTQGVRFLPKLAKEILFAAFVLFSIFLLHQRRSAIPLASAGPILLMSAVAALGFVLSFASSGLAHATLGTRSFEFLLVALLGSWAARELPSLSRWLAVLLFMQAILVALELRFGMPLRSCPNSFRVAGTMVLPNTLGVVVVSALAFYVSFRPERSRLLLLLPVALALLLASGSGTGLVLMLVLGAWFILVRVGPRRAWLAAGAIAIAGVGLAITLPALTSRPDIYDSLFAAGGRVDKLTQVVRANDFAANLFGQGLGVGTNATASLASAVDPNVQGFYADSTVTVLLTQLGFLGVTAFYLMLAWAFAKDPKARPFYLVVGVAGLTLNLPEVFPVNFLIGIALARSAWVAAHPRAETEAPP